MGLSDFFGGGKSKSTSYIREQKDALKDAPELYTPQLGVNENGWQRWSISRPHGGSRYDRRAD